MTDPVEELVKALKPHSCSCPGLCETPEDRDDGCKIHDLLSHFYAARGDWVMVPREPTIEQKAAIRAAVERCLPFVWDQFTAKDRKRILVKITEAAYRAMIAVANPEGNDE
jgi:hypothetical protein